MIARESQNKKFYSFEFYSFFYFFIFIIILKVLFFEFPPSLKMDVGSFETSYVRSTSFFLKCEKFILPYIFFTNVFEIN